MVHIVGSENNPILSEFLCVFEFYKFSSLFLWVLDVNRVLLKTPNRRVYKC